MYFVDERLTPPPLIHIGRFYNNFIKFKYYSNWLTPPPPALINILKFNNIFLKYFL